MCQTKRKQDYFFQKYRVPYKYSIQCEILFHWADFYDSAVSWSDKVITPGSFLFASYLKHEFACYKRTSIDLKEARKSRCNPAQPMTDVIRV